MFSVKQVLLMALYIDVISIIQPLPKVVIVQFSVLISAPFQLAHSLMAVYVILRFTRSKSPNPLPV